MRSRLLPPTFFRIPRPAAGMLACLALLITPAAAAPADLSVSISATCEEQQVNQAGLMFNSAIPGQAFPTGPNYFSSTRVTAGRRIQYTLTVTNGGPDAATNVQLTNRLPAGVSIYQGSLTAPAGVNCETGTPGETLDRMRCGLGTMNATTSKTVSFQVVTDASLEAGTVLGNDALALSDTADATNGNNVAGVTNTVLAAADMRASSTSMGEVTASSDILHRPVVQNLAGQVTPGQVLRYEVTVQNNGPSDSRSVTVQDTLPPTSQVEYLSADGADCRADDVQANVIYCGLGDMAAGERRTFDLYVRVNQATATVGSNCALVLSSSSNTSPPGPPPTPPTGGPTQLLTWDPNTTDNQACATVALVPAADLSVVATASSEQVNAGEQVRYTLRVENAGPSAARDALLDVLLPENAVHEIDTGGCVPAGTVPDSLDCPLGALGAGEAREFVVWVRLRPPTPPGSVLQAEATVSDLAGTADPDATYNAAVAEVLATGKADLKVLVFGPPDGRARAGDTLTHTVLADNLGPGWAHDVTVENLLVSEGTFKLQSIDSDRAADCTPAPGTYSGNTLLTCRLTPPLEETTPFQSGRWKLTVTLGAAEGLALNSVVRALGIDPDPDPANNSAAVAYDVESVADLALAASAAPASVYPGDGVILALTVLNAGPSPADGVRVQTRLPAGVTLREATVEGGPGSCGGFEPLVCALGTLAAGESRVVRVEARPDLGLPRDASLHFSSQVASDVNDVDPADNFASAHARILSLLLFSDGFSDGGRTGDPQWDVLSGRWKVNLNEEFKTGATRDNLAVVNDPAVGSLAAASLEADLKLTKSFTAYPSGAIVFGYREDGGFRYAKLLRKGRRARMQIGQVGDFDGEGAGVKADRSARVVLGAWNHLRVDIHPDGWVRAYLNDQTAPAASYRFPAPAPGKAGCRAERAATYFDNFSAWYETVLP